MPALPRPPLTTSSTKATSKADIPLRRADYRHVPRLEILLQAAHLRCGEELLDTIDPASQADYLRDEFR